jgi:hypothetical protein
VPFTAGDHLVFERKRRLARDSDGMRFTAYNVAGSMLRERAYYSVGAGWRCPRGQVSARDPPRPGRMPGRLYTVSECPTRPLPFLIFKIMSGNHTTMIYTSRNPRSRKQAPSLN